MSKVVLFSYKGWSIKRLANSYLKHNIPSAPVIAGDHGLVGVVSISDIFRFDNLDKEKKLKLFAITIQSATKTNFIPRILRTEAIAPRRVVQLI